MEAGIIAALVALAGSILSVASAIFLFLWRKVLETRSTNKAILAEVYRLLQVVVPDHAAWKGKTDPKYPLIRFSTPVYRAHVKNIGRLDSKIVALVVEFYGYLAYINSLQALRPRYSTAGIDSEFNDQYQKSLNRLLEDFKGKFDVHFAKYNIEGSYRPAAAPDQAPQTSMDKAA